jgi:hypothetical protein
VHGIHHVPFPSLFAKVFNRELSVLNLIEKGFGETALTILGDGES